MLIGDEIKRLRIERVMTQQELADACGLSRSYISRIESDDMKPNIDILNSLLNGLGYEMNIRFVELPSI